MLRVRVAQTTARDGASHNSQGGATIIGFSSTRAGTPAVVRVVCSLAVAFALVHVIPSSGIAQASRPPREPGARLPLQAEIGPPSQPQGDIQGRIVGGYDEQPVPGAEIVLTPGNRRTLSGDDGRFLFEGVPAGRYRIRVTALGYRETTIDAFVHEEASTSVLVTLERAPIPLAAMVIAPGRFGILDVDPALMGSAITREEIEAIPSLGEDAFRTLQRMPGVASPDISTKLYVRGSTGRDLLVRLDGLELFEPYHLKDWDGMFGIVDVQALGSIDLITGGFPAEFGDKWGGVFDMRTRRPPPSGRRTSVGFSLGGPSLISQGSFAEGRGQWLASLRRGFLDIMLDIAKVSDEVSPGYWDALGKVHYLLSDRHALSVELLHAGDDVTWDDPGAGSRVDSEWANSYGWLTLTSSLTPRLRVGTILSTGRVTRDRTGTGGNPDDGVFTPLSFHVSDVATFTFAGIKQDWGLDVTDDLLLKAGFDLRFSSGEYDYYSWANRRDLDEDGRVIVVPESTEVREDPSSTELGAYLAARARLHASLTGEVGARFDRQSHTGDADIAPRAMLRWDVGESSSVRASWGQYFQSQGISELNVMDGESAYATSERADQVAVGLERDFGQGMHGRVEAYTRRVATPRPVYWNLAREIDPIMEVEADRTRISPTRGRARGLELILSKEENGPLSWAVSYALASTELLVDGEWIPHALDQIHTLNLHASYRHGTKWQVSGTWQYHTGWPYTEQFLDVDLIFGEDGQVTGTIVRRGFGPLDAERLPAYHRLDLRVTRSIELRRGRLELYLDIFNAYNQNNLRGYRYNLWLNPAENRFTTERVDGDRLLPILPNVGLRWTF